MAQESEYSAADLSAHAREEMIHRGISEEEIRAVLRAPGQVESARPGRIVLSGLQQATGQRTFVLRVFVDIDRSPPVVVTAYRSSKISKYWSQP
jgi:hypothetical protein